VQSATLETTGVQSRPSDENEISRASVVVLGAPDAFESRASRAAHHAPSSVTWNAGLPPTYDEASSRPAARAAASASRRRAPTNRAGAFAAYPPQPIAGFRCGSRSGSRRDINCACSPVYVPV